MIFSRNHAFRSLLVYFALLSFSQTCEPSAVAHFHSQLYVKMRSSCRFTLGVQIGRIKSFSLASCAAHCLLSSCQSFEFGCPAAPSTRPCKPVCLIYKNVPPRLDDDYFEDKPDNDYYEVVFPLPPQNYSQCEGWASCHPGTFCGKVVRRVESDGLYKVAVRTACYTVFLNASEALDWNQSKVACSNGGGKLIEPADLKEQMLVVDLMNRMANHSNFMQAVSAPTVWLGCSGGLKGWNWLEGSNITNTFWHGTNPDNLRDVNCCASRYTSPAAQTFWIDRNCIDKTARMCIYEH